MQGSADEIKKVLEAECSSGMEHFKQELSQVRSGRPSPALVENIMIDCYQSKMPLKQVAAINILPPSTIVIEPWDKTVLPSIAQAISRSELQLAPIADGDTVRLSLPPLSQERRGQLIKLVHDYGEGAKIKIRLAREKANKQIEALYKDKALSEDERFKFKDQIQKIIDEFNKKTEDLIEQKEKELTTK
ncbi:ribosome recycling factor [Candidatus Parcubacteria bacterium]|nr:MAG: ribosome recycling factor [Candidatus Parcubacteria bacterium]